MVVSAPPDASRIDAFVGRLLMHRETPQEFLAELNRSVAERQFNTAHLAELSKRLPHLGHSDGSLGLALDYLLFLHQTGNISPKEHLDALTQFEVWQQLDEVALLADKVERFAREVRFHCNSAALSDSHQFSELLFRCLEWHVIAIDALVRVHIDDNTAELEAEFAAQIAELVIRLISGIRGMRSHPFSALLIHVYFVQLKANKSAASNPMPRLLGLLEYCIATLGSHIETAENDKNGEENRMEVDHRRSPLGKCQSALGELLDQFPEFTSPPKGEWTPFREDFIKRRHRPAILTLGSIYAVFRMLKSADEVADAFLTMGQVLGMREEQTVEDLLRAGFLIQLETTQSLNSSATQMPLSPAASLAAEDQREREALADVFVFFKMPQVLAKLLERGVPRQALAFALRRLSECASLLDELDARKSDNVFRFFMDSVRRLEILSATECEALVASRDAEREQNEELMAHTCSATNPPSVGARSELINRVQKAKNAIDRLSPEKTEEMLCKLINLIKLDGPIDILCAIYCANNELSQFSGWLAALNAQTQLQQGAEAGGMKAVASTAQGRLLIFDFTFLLMARIQMVFPDLRLEELVGGRVNCAFYRWNQRYNKCVESGEPMEPLLNGGLLSGQAVLDEQFRATFQDTHFVAMRSAKQPFWSAEESDFGAVLETVPLLGELLLDEFEQHAQQQPELGQLHNVLATFRHLSSLWLCLVQWLDTQPSTREGRQTMARALLDWQKQTIAIEKDAIGHERLYYAQRLARRTLRQMAEARVKKEHPYTWLIGFAQRPLPALPVGRKMALLRADKEELKEEKQRLKEVFFCANQQGWASPDAVAHINRCNVSCRMDIWLHCWMTQMMNQLRIVTVDEGDLAAELCLAAAFTYPVPCLCEIIKNLVECMLFVPNRPKMAQTTTITESGAAANSAGGQQQVGEPQLQQLSTLETHLQQHKSSSSPTRHPVVGEFSPKATVVAKMLVRALQLLLWAGDRNAMERREREKRIQQMVGGAQTGTQQTAAAPDKDSQSRKRKLPQMGHSGLKPSSVGGLEPTSSEGSGSEELLSGEPPKGTSQQQQKTATAYSKQQKAAIDTVRNVFERFDRIVRECTLRPPVTFIVFFVHELAQTPRTEYWRRLVDMMPPELIFVLARLDPAALPLDLFLRIYDPREGERSLAQCVQYACMMRTLGQI